MTNPVPRTGDIILTTIGGALGAAINIGQAIIRDSSRFTHAAIYVGDGMIVQAMPSGAELVPLSTHKEYVVFHPPGLSEVQRWQIADEARKLVGTPYSFADYLALSLEHFKLGFGWTRRYVGSSGHLICSQLVDEAYLRAGVHLFDDGRLPGQVTPGDLSWLVFEYYEQLRSSS